MYKKNRKIKIKCEPGIFIVNCSSKCIIFIMITIHNVVFGYIFNVQ